MADGDAGKAKGGGMKGVAVGLALAIAIGLGTGWGAGTMLAGSPTDGRADTAPVDDVMDYADLPGATAVVALPPLLTGLRAPEGTWVRLELAAVFAGEPDAATADAVHADALAYLRSLSLPEIASPSGYAFLRADLAARAADISNGAVTGLLVRTFLIE